jgi:molybdopterin-guanine dinucleotide biosynthesis protein A
LAGIILSGGENSRMGRNKAFLTLKGRMFLWIIIEALSPLFDDLVLVTREPERYEGFPVRTVSDVFPERGPLTGIFSGLSATPDQKNFCVGCDMPMINTGLVQYMMNMAYGFDAVVPLVKGQKKKRRSQIEPLHAVYDKSCLPVMERNLVEGRKSLTDLVRSLNVRYLSEGEAACCDPDLRSFQNINRPEEYQSLTSKV